MKYPIFLYITAIAVRIVNSGIIYSVNSLPQQYYSPRYSYLHQPAFLIPHTYNTAIASAESDSPTAIFELKHHHPDHHGNSTDEEEQKPVAADSSSSEQPLNNPETQADTTILAPTTSGHDTLAVVPVQTNDLKYIALSAPVTYTIPTPLAWPIASQFHQQDGLGQYYYGYANLDSSKQELKTYDGITRGAYSFADANGVLQTVTYISDDVNGFRVAATNLPKAPSPVEIPDSPDIVLAKQEHFKAQKLAIDRVNAANAINNNEESTDSNTETNTSSDSKPSEATN